MSALSIRQRLILWYTLVLMIMLVGFAAAVFVGGTFQLQRATDQGLQLTVRQLTESLLRGEEPLVVDTSYRLLRLDGQVLHASGLPVRCIPIDPAALAAARQGNTWRETVTTLIIVPEPLPMPGPAAPRRLLPLQVRVLTVPLGQPPLYILQVGRATADVQRLQGLLVTILLIALGVGLPAAGLGGWWLAGRALDPVRAMTETAQRIEASSLNERLPQPSRNDELTRLAATINQLLDRLQAAFQRERRFTADVSHDLRTPLALAKSTIGVALNRPRTAEELRATLVDLDGQLDRVTGLLEAILFLTRADSNQLTQTHEPLDLSESLTDLAETIAAHASETHGQILTCEVASDLWVQGDRDQLTRLFLNLLDNAMQYAPDGGVIRLIGRAEDGHVLVDVEDNGAGIAPDDLPHVFDSFYRVDKARTKGNQSHHGLGLSIAQAVARAHGGEITATSQLGQGARFTVRLPRCATQ